LRVFLWLNQSRLGGQDGNTIAKGQEKLKQTKVEGKWEKEKEIIVRREIVFPKWKRWNHDDFSRGWQKNYSI